MYGPQRFGVVVAEIGADVLAANERWIADDEFRVWPIRTASVGGRFLI